MNIMNDSSPSIIKLLQTAKRAGREAGKLIMSELGDDLKVQKKVRRDIVTKADEEAEQLIVNTIQEEFPSHTIITEEEASIEKDSDYEWVVDPIDGTINYANSFPLFNVSVAVWKNRETLVGVVFVPYLDELFYAVKGYGAFLNDLPINTSSKENLDQALVSGILTSHYSDSRIQETVSFISMLAKKCRGVRLIISEALELSYIAAGRIDANFVHKADIYGAAAGKLIIEEAGGVVTELYGEPFRFNSSSLLASCTKELHKEIVGLTGNPSKG